MRAILVRAFGGPDVLRLEEVPDPQAGPGEVLVRLRAAGINPVEVYVRSGAYASLPELPYVPGCDGAGEVVAVGAGVAGLHPGQRVYVAARSGTYAELASVPAATVHPLPDGVGFEQGAALGIPYGTAYRAIHQRGAAKPGEWLLVHGATGGVGTAAVQLGLAHGMRVVATAGSAAGAALLTELGAQYVLDHGDAAHFSEVLRLSGVGVDVILEMRADINLGRDLEVLAPDGRVVVVGSRGPVTIDARNTMGRNADIRGMNLPGTPAPELRQIHAALGAGLRSGTLVPVIGRRFPLAEAGAGHEAVMAAGAQGKIVLVP